MTWPFPTSGGGQSRLRRHPWSASVDIGNLVVSHGAQPVLTDLGQRDYSLVTTYPWRALTKAHTTLGVLQPDGRVTQTDMGWGSVSATPDGLQMVSANAMSGVEWTRGTTVTDSSVTVRDQLRPAHTLVVLTPTLVDTLDLTTDLVRLDP